MKKEQEQDKNFKISSDVGYTYDQFIKDILEKRGRFNCEENFYKERHHILPKSKGGDNSTENLIDLYGREHFIAHKLLAKENPSDKQLTFAWWMMAHCFGRDYQDRYQVSPEEYEDAKQKASVEISKMKKGFKFSEESKKKMSESHKRLQVGENHPLFGKHPSIEAREKMSKSKKGKKLSKEIREKISEGHKNPSQETRNKISKGLKGKYIREKSSMYGKHHTKETKEKIRKSLEGAKSYRAKKVSQFDKEGNFIKTWDFIKQAEEELGISHTHISNCCRGKRKTAGGFIWKYAE